MSPVQIKHECMFRYITLCIVVAVSVPFDAISSRIQARSKSPLQLRSGKSHSFFRTGWYEISEEILRRDFSKLCGWKSQEKASKLAGSLIISAKENKAIKTNLSTARHTWKRGVCCGTFGFGATPLLYLVSFCAQEKFREYLALSKCFLRICEDRGSVDLLPMVWGMMFSTFSDSRPGVFFCLESLLERLVSGVERSIMGSSSCHRTSPPSSAPCCSAG